MMKPQNITRSVLDQALGLLAERLRYNGAPPQYLVVCGGSGLIALDLVPRTTSDVDVVALTNALGTALLDPDPLSPELIGAAHEVAPVLGLDLNWLNNGPSKGDGGLFRMGLPVGFLDRCHPRSFGTHLTVRFIGRLDQIHFKVYAAVDRGGYHVADLQALQPAPDELVRAARRAMTHDVSEGFQTQLRGMFRSLGYESAAARV